jgi:hypothetical protein
MAEMTRAFIKKAKEDGLIPYDMKFSVTFERSQVRILLTDVPQSYTIFRESYYEYFAQSGSRPRTSDLKDPFLKNKAEEQYVINSPDSKIRFSDDLFKILIGIEDYVSSYQHSVHYMDQEGGGYENFDYSIRVDESHNILLNESWIYTEKQIQYFLIYHKIDDVKTLIYWYFNHHDPINQNALNFLNAMQISLVRNPFINNTPATALLKGYKLKINEISLYLVLDELLLLMKIEDLLCYLHNIGKDILSMNERDYQSIDISVNNNPFNPQKMKCFIEPRDMQMIFKFGNSNLLAKKVEWKNIGEIYNWGCTNAPKIYLVKYITQNSIPFEMNQNYDFIEIRLIDPNTKDPFFLYIIWNRPESTIRFGTYNPITNVIFNGDIIINDEKRIIEIIEKIKPYIAHLDQEKLILVIKEIEKFAHDHYK